MWFSQSHFREAQWKHSYAYQDTRFLENEIRKKLSFHRSGVYPLMFGIRVLMVWKGTEDINMLTGHDKRQLHFVISEAINSTGRTNWIKKEVPVYNLFTVFYCTEFELMSSQ